VADVLREYGAAPVRVFVVWEPVLATDWGNPGAAMTSYIPDPRAIHFWDPGRRLSALYGGPANLPRLAATQKAGFHMKDVVWDTALVYPPGLKWGAPATLLVAPVVKHRSDLAAAL